MSTYEIMIKDALRYMGMPLEKADETLKNKVIEAFNFLEQHIKPRYVYDRFNYQMDQEMIKIENTISYIESKDLSKLLTHSKSLVLMAATLGPEVDKKIMLKQKIDMLEAVILDAAASVYIDKVCDDIESQMMKELVEGEFLTMRFSPGYGDVPLNASSDILDILGGGRRIGLTISASHMLIPTKSITAIIGISNQKENRQKSCGKCYLVKTCSYRRRGEQCGL